MENEYAFQDATKETKNSRVVDKPIQSTMKGEQYGGMLYLLYFVLYSIFFSMFFPS